MKKLNSIYIVFVLLIIAFSISLGYLTPERGLELVRSPTTWMVVISAFFLILSFVAIFKAMDTMKWLIQKKEGKLEEEEEEEIEDQDSFLSTVWKKLQDSRPIEEEADIELDHNYDGIRELDNNLPPWWLWGFYLSMVFAVVYLVRHHITGSAPLQIEEYQIELAEAEKSKAEYLKNAADLVDENSVVALTGVSILKEGAKIFATSCAVCHGPDGGGTVGPNLTDEYWLHGGSVNDVFSTIKYGVPSKGMVPWKDQMGASDMQKVASFILSIKGTQPSNPKAPQGDLYQQEIIEEVSAEETDTTQTELTPL